MKGIDVSYWQGPNIDFNKVKADGYDFVIIRAGYAKSIDKCWEVNYKKAKEAGLHVGAYWFQYAVSASDAINEAKTFIGALKGKQLDFPVYYDQEPDGEKTPPTSKYEAFAYAFCQTMEAAGYFAGIYTSESFLRYYQDEFKQRFTLWIANWSKEPSQTTYPAMGVWQKSSKGNVGGISQVDLDVSYKDFPTIIKKAGLNGYTRTPTSVVEETPVTPTPEPELSPESTSSKTRSQTGLKALAKRVIAGQFGNGDVRKKALSAYVQKRVNYVASHGYTPATDYDDVIKDIWNGLYGNGEKRANEIYNEVQTQVNKMLS